MLNKVFRSMKLSTLAFPGWRQHGAEAQEHCPRTQCVGLLELGLGLGQELGHSLQCDLEQTSLVFWVSGAVMMSCFPISLKSSEAFGPH